MKTLFIKISASGLGLGYIPFASGTWGSLLGIPLFLALSQLPQPLVLPAIVALTGLAIYVAHQAEVVFGKRDSGTIVIDEIVGMLWALLLVPLSITNVILAFLLFRFFDIAKIFPANFCENNLRGGWAVVLDDVVAGLYGGLAVLLINHIMSRF